MQSSSTAVISRVGKNRFFHTSAGQDSLCVWIAVKRCHPEKKGLLAYASTKLCCTSTILNDRETVKLSRNVMIPSQSQGHALRWVGSWERATSAPSTEAAQCHRETLLPAGKHPLWSGTKLHCPLIHIQEISTMRATVLSVNKCVAEVIRRQQQVEE